MRPARWGERWWGNAREFATGSGAATLLWPRWLLLRAMGLVYGVIFAGILVEGQALVGPSGIFPLGNYFEAMRSTFSTESFLFLRAPSIFWLDTSAGMIAAVAGLGLLAALALVFNFWPRLALFVCWGAFLSFVTTWGEFSPAQLDRLMLEAALLCIPFAPRGLRPGLGADSPPRAIATFVMRWLLLRVMLESGLVKLISADSHWRALTAMDVMYETSPSPTVLGYWIHQLPHSWHVGEIFFTFTAELVAPVLAVFGGRRSRWVAFGLWSALQIGIQLTCNFGWLNLAALGLGLLILDDRMIASVAGRLRWGGLAQRVGQVIAAKAGVGATSTVAGTVWRRHGLRVALGLHFLLTLYYFAEVCGAPTETWPALIERSVAAVAEFRSANGYHLYRNFEAAHYQIDFEGSDDGGHTWRTYELRHLPQRVDRRPSFTAPWFPRFETTLQIASSRPPQQTIVPRTAARLLAGTPEVLGLFRENPFPAHPPSVVRMRRYKLAFTAPATLREKGAYWKKEYAGDYLPPLHVDAEGRLAFFDLGAPDTLLKAGNRPAALAEYERQYRLGYVDAGLRLAEVCAQGIGGPPQPEKAFALFRELADRGEVKAMHNLGLCYDYGIGTRPDPAQAAAAYRHAAEQGYVMSFLSLGKLAADDRLTPRNDVEGLTVLLVALARSSSDDPQSTYIRENEPALARQLMARMTPAEIARAQAQAKAWP